MQRFGLLVTTGLAATLLFSGCSTNSGGDTTCKEFNTQDESTQNSAVSEMLKDEKGTDPSNLEITATRLSALTYCKTLGKEDTKIREAPHV